MTIVGVNPVVETPTAPRFVVSQDREEDRRSSLVSSQSRSIGFKISKTNRAHIEKFAGVDTSALYSSPRSSLDKAGFTVGEFCYSTSIVLKELK